MAHRRMFAKSITNSSKFLMMPEGAQSLYFHLGMNADDDGYCEHFMIMRMTGSNADNLKLLGAKGFVKIFDDKVLIISDWKENNYLRPDRYTPSKYLITYTKECKLDGIPDSNQRYTQDRLGKDSIGKVSKDRKTHPSKPIKHQYMETVYFTTAEYFKLKTAYGRDGVRERAENLNLYQLSKGKKYPSSYHTILNWDRMDKKKNSVSPQKQPDKPVRKEKTLAEMERQYL